MKLIDINYVLLLINQKIIFYDYMKCYSNLKFIKVMMKTLIIFLMQLFIFTLILICNQYYLINYFII